MKYHVAYYYKATGMEGGADTEDFGVWEANSKDEAIDAAIKNRHPIDKIDYPCGQARSLWDWLRLGLEAHEKAE